MAAAQSSEHLNFVFGSGLGRIDVLVQSLAWNLLASGFAGPSAERVLIIAWFSKCGLHLDKDHVRQGEDWCSGRITTIAIGDDIAGDFTNGSVANGLPDVLCLRERQCSAALVEVR